MASGNRASFDDNKYRALTTNPFKVGESFAGVTDEGHPLTAREISMLKHVFKNSIPYPDIRIHPHGMAVKIVDNWNRPAISPKGEVYFKKKHYAPDFFTDTSIYQKTLFVHEMVHVWQHFQDYDVLANGLKLHNKYGERAYDYLLMPNIFFEAYNLEAQAAMIQDWFLVRRLGITTNPSFRQCSSTSGDYYVIKKDGSFDWYWFGILEQTLSKFLSNPASHHLPPIGTANQDHLLLNIR